MKAYKGWVRDAGGGEVSIILDRSTPEYPSVGDEVFIVGGGFSVQGSKIEAQYNAAIEALRRYQEGIVENPMKRGLVINGPNRGEKVKDSRLRRGGVYRMIDPSERSFTRLYEKDPLAPIKTNTYWIEPANPFAKAYGFDFLLRWSH